MLKNSSSQKFCRLFISHIHEFMTSHDLICVHKPVVLAVSGGIDSMALLFVFIELKIPFEVLHFNHGTRGVDNLREEQGIISLSKKFQFKLQIIKLELNNISENFEHVARLKRQEVYKKYIQEGSWVYTAHHLDDSFEWSLMQSFKNSHTRSNLGIPLFSNGIVRPFLCVSKNHIKKFMQHLSVIHTVKWYEDKSNETNKFERNRFRHLISAPIYHEYKNVLKHYASRSNERAYELKSHQLQKNIKLNNRFCRISVDHFGGITITSNSYFEHKERIKKQIHLLSTKKRGEIDTECSKILKMIDRSLLIKDGVILKGPHQLSGGVLLYVFAEEIYLIHRQQLNLFLERDRQLKEKLQNSTGSQIPVTIVCQLYPKLIIHFNGSTLPKNKIIHPLLKLTCEWLKEREIPYTFDQLLSEKHRQKLNTIGFMLDSSL